MDPQKFDEKQYRENELKKQSNQAIKNDIPLRPNEADPAVRLFYRNQMFEQTKAIQRSMIAAVFCAVFAGVSAASAVASLIILASRIFCKAQ